MPALSAEHYNAGYQVVTQVTSAGFTRIDYVPIEGLATSGCNSHRRAANVAAALIRNINSHPYVWTTGSGEPG